MNKLFSLLLLIVMVTVGACSLDNTQPKKIRGMKARDDGNCNYYLNGLSDDRYVVDTCDAFQIGDHIQFQKVQP